MHYAISTTWGPTDTTRASLPFLFAATALDAGDSVMIMLFHDAVMVAIRGTHEKLVPVGPAPAFSRVLADENAEVLVCKPCAEARGIGEDALAARCRFAGMKDLHDHASRENCKVIAF
jgi:sulfur relay (sulfurtransferase) complex TusBCD TusD component (DsrE family)